MDNSQTKAFTGENLGILLEGVLFWGRKWGKQILKNPNKFKLQCGKIVMLQTACSGKSESCILGYVIGTQYWWYKW